MKYFTPQLWIGFNSPRSKVAFATFNRRFRSYRKQLRKLLPKLNPKARGFFQNICLLHDSTLLRLEVGDRIDSIPHGLKRFGIDQRRTSVRLYALSRSGDFIHMLHYKEASRIDLNYPGKLVLFPVGAYPNFGDWGYDELTAEGENLLRHEILFASGSTIAIEFSDFAYFRKRYRK